MSGKQNKIISILTERKGQGDFPPTLFLVREFWEIPFCFDWKKFFYKK